MGGEVKNVRGGEVDRVLVYGHYSRSRLGCVYFLIGLGMSSFKLVVTAENYKG
jgi:hypothetical protein